MGKFWAGLIAGVLIIPILVALYIMLGLAPAAATAPPLPFERFLAGAALERRISREAPSRDVSGFPVTDLVSGADVYRKNCATCHGIPGQAPPSISKGMFPRAPQLLSPEGSVADDPAGVTYWKLQNGIRLSGMPSFSSALTVEQMWDVSALLARADKLPPEALDALKATPDPPSLIPAVPRSAPRHQR